MKKRLENKNRKTGNDFEASFCDVLFSYGFWVHNLAQNQTGHPADVIAARNGGSYLIDCKVCSRKGFDFKRVEENQDSAMSLWSDRGNKTCWFAIKLNDDAVFMVSHYIIKAYREVQSSLSNDEIRELGIPFERWEKKCK